MITAWSLLRRTTLFPLQIGDIWFGKTGTAYEGVQATVKAVTKRNIQISYDRIVQVDGMQLAGEVMGQRAFFERFEVHPTNEFV